MDGVTRGNGSPKKLTDLAIKNLKAGPARREISDGKNGLFVVLQPGGRKSFAVRYRFDGHPRKLTLPRGITLAAARKAAADAIHEVEQGRDPAGAKRQAKEAQRIAAANTFQAVAESYLEREAKKEEGRRLRSLKWRRTLLERLVYPTLGDRPITAIKRRAIIELLDAIEDGKLVNAKGPIKGGATMAHVTLAVIRKIMRWHATCDEDYVVPIVPGMGRIKPDEHARSRILTDDELRRVWRTAESRPNDPFAAMIRFMLLTACRRSEAAALTWDEIVTDDIGPCWLLPAARNKVKVDLIRPLSEAAQELLAAQPRIDECPYVVTYGRRPLAAFSQCKDEFDEASGVTGWTLHDLRRTARTLMSRAGIISDHAEQCLGHLLYGVRKTYNRDDFKPQKKAAFEALAGLIYRIVNPPAADVTPLRRPVGAP
jgi:integrase